MTTSPRFRKASSFKAHNDYAAMLPWFGECPKAVFAAMAVSLASCGGDRLSEAEELLADEWECLYRAGIVTQRPPWRIKPVPVVTP